MFLAKVVGTVVSTSKDERLVGCKLLLTQRITPEGAPIGEPDVSIDNVGAGNGEIVLVATGSAARLASGRAEGPIDATIVGIVDVVEAVR
ncbi:MAG TPA: EutN/CcmL family microcompartment protein [Dermatophilaceae bacterium]|jgi:microcompartment protein CcmK/EutM